MVYNDEQQQLHDSAQDFLAARSPVEAARRLRDDGVAEGFDPKVWAGMRELGWSAVAFAEIHGGLAFGLQGYAPLFEQIGRHLCASPLLSSVVLCGSLIERCGSEAQQAQWLPALISGEQRMALALEEGARHASQPVALQAQANASGFVLDGTKSWVLDGLGADQFLTVGRTPSGELALFLVPATAPGVRIEALALVDSRNHARVQFEQVQVPASARLVSGDACAALELALESGRACLAAELLGMAERCFELTLDYLKTRVQFDAPIGSFQALQHRAARQYVQLQLARSAVMAAFEALELADISASERCQRVSLGKWKANEMAQLVSNEAVQMHGGIGVTDEYDLGLYLKRIRVAQACLGDSDYLCSLYGETLN
nr:acyl-CoA dehydrogenase family protein [Pseudomonas sp. R5(2019)]